MSERFTIRREIDFIALAPVVLRFHPTNSLVMMTIDSFHARVDLPEEWEQIDALVNGLLEPAIKHKVERVAFIIFGEDGHDYAELKKALLNAFMGAGIELLAALETQDRKWKQFWDTEWEPLDLSDHPLTLEAQFHDLAPRHASRAEMTAYIKPKQAEMSDEVQQAVQNLMDTEVSAVVQTLTREGAKDAVALWTEALRGCEPGTEFISDVAIVLSFAAWLNGDGALAWVALDHVHQCSKWHEIIYTLLDRAVNPSGWEQVIANASSSE